MDFAKQIYLLWFLACASAKHLPGPESAEVNRGFPYSDAELTLDNDTLIEDFPFDTSNETLVEFFDNVTDNEPSPNLETNSVQTVIPESEETGGGSLKKVFLSNDSIVCNDGSPAGYYIRKSPTASPVWIVFLEGGWYCYDRQSCRNRWLRLRHLMTSTQWPDTREVSGILSDKHSENPFWHSANHVIVPYCSSDTWSGTTSITDDTNDTFHFMGKLIVLQVMRDLVSRGLENSTQLIFAGSSAGGTGVMINLDPVQHLLHAELGLKHIAVRGITDSGWFLDRTPYSPTSLPAVDAIKKGYALWQGSLPKRCVVSYPEEPWRCYFGYRLYPTLRAPLFVFQWLFDEAQMTADNVGAPVTPQQWDYIHRMGNALRSSFEDVTALFAPSCVSHSILTKREWLHVSIDDVTVAHAIRCWELSTMKKSTKYTNTLWNPKNNKSARKLVKSGSNRHSPIINGSSFQNKFNRNQTENIRRNETNKNLRIQNRRRRKKLKGNSNENLKTEQNKKNNENHQRIWNHDSRSSRNNFNAKFPQMRIQNQRRKNNFQNQQRKSVTKNANRKQHRRKNNSHPCSKENNISRINQRLQPNKRNGQLKCYNGNRKNIRRHIRNRNRSPSRNFNRLTYHNDSDSDLTLRPDANERNKQSSSFSNGSVERQMRLQRSLIRGLKSMNSGCEHRHIERCSWPQCNHSCPRLLDPFTGEEINFIDMLKSFGLEMESVAQALGVDMQTLNNMEHAELLNLLTQQSN